MLLMFVIFLLIILIQNIKYIYNWINLIIDYLENILISIFNESLILANVGGNQDDDFSDNPNPGLGGTSSDSSSEDDLPLSKRWKGKGKLNDQFPNKRASERESSLGGVKRKRGIKSDMDQEMPKPKKIRVGSNSLEILSSPHVSSSSLSEEDTVEDSFLRFNRFIRRLQDAQTEAIRNHGSTPGIGVLPLMEIPSAETWYLLHTDIIDNFINLLNNYLRLMHPVDADFVRSTYLNGNYFDRDNLLHGVRDWLLGSSTERPIDLRLLNMLNFVNNNINNQLSQQVNHIIELGQMLDHLLRDPQFTWRGENHLFDLLDLNQINLVNSGTESTGTESTGTLGDNVRSILTNPGSFNDLGDNLQSIPTYARLTILIYNYIYSWEVLNQFLSRVNEVGTEEFTSLESFNERIVLLRESFPVNTIASDTVDHLINVLRFLYLRINYLNHAWMENYTMFNSIVPVREVPVEGGSQAESSTARWLPTFNSLENIRNNGTVPTSFLDALVEEFLSLQSTGVNSYNLERDYHALFLFFGQNLDDIWIAYHIYLSNTRSRFIQLFPRDHTTAWPELAGFIQHHRSVFQIPFNTIQRVNDMINTLSMGWSQANSDLWFEAIRFWDDTDFMLEFPTEFYDLDNHVVNPYHLPNPDSPVGEYSDESEAPSERDFSPIQESEKEDDTRSNDSDHLPKPEWSKRDNNSTHRLIDVEKDIENTKKILSSELDNEQIHYYLFSKIPFWLEKLISIVNHFNIYILNNIKMGLSEISSELFLVCGVLLGSVSWIHSNILYPVGILIWALDPTILFNWNILGLLIVPVIIIIWFRKLYHSYFDNFPLGEEYKSKINMFFVNFILNIFYLLLTGLVILTFFNWLNNINYLVFLWSLIPLGKIGIFLSFIVLYFIIKNIKSDLLIIKILKPLCIIFISLLLIQLFGISAGPIFLIIIILIAWFRLN